MIMTSPYLQENHINSQGKIAITQSWAGSYVFTVKSTIQPDVSICHPPPLTTESYILPNTSLPHWARLCTWSGQLDPLPMIWDLYCLAHGCSSCPYCLDDKAKRPWLQRVCQDLCISVSPLCNQSILTTQASCGDGAQPSCAKEPREKIVCEASSFGLDKNSFHRLVYSSA